VAPAEHVLRTSARGQQITEWSVVLAAAGLRYRVAESADGWQLLVPDSEAPAALSALEDYERERAAAAPPPLPWPEYGRTHAGMVCAGLILAFDLLTRQHSEWFRRGTAVAERILAGEIWRTVTALTLHGGPAHVLANAASAAFFVSALARTLGPGVAAWLLLLSGACGNALNALVRGAPHSSLGASTAIFGAIGALGGLQAVRRARRRRTPASRPWVPVAGSLALLAMLGTGEDVDLGAHLWGLAVGCVGGAAAAFLPRPPRAWVQALLVLGALAVVVASWLFAFRSGAA
jgi:membrane associated rhomboid family serine protease